MLKSCPLRSSFFVCHLFVSVHFELLRQVKGHILLLRTCSFLR